MSLSHSIRLACIFSGSLSALMAQGIGNISVAAQPSSYTGRAPAHIRFVARIELAGARTFNYHWERSDGAKGPVKVVKVGNPSQGMITVVETWQLGAPGQQMEVWEKVHVNCGNQHISSDPAMVSISCR
jgi:hypothetical protein